MPRALVVIVIFVWFECAAFAQSPFVYLVKAGSCLQLPKVRQLTGFRALDSEHKGILTSLHGVLGCENISARDEEGNVFSKLEILDVDIEADTALLSSADLRGAVVTGLPLAQDLPSDEKPLKVYGHPSATAIHGDTLTFRIPRLRPLEDEVSGTVLTNLLKRGSPSIKLNVLSLAGPLQPGHSGAPILDSAGKVIAIGNGGLRGGTAGTGWAIPYKSIHLRPASNQQARLSQIELSGTEGLFDYESSEPEPTLVLDKGTLEKDLRRIFDGTGMTSWTSTTGVLDYTEKRTFLSFDQCVLRFHNKLETSNTSSPDTRGTITDSDIVIDLSEVEIKLLPRPAPGDSGSRYPLTFFAVSLESPAGFKLVKVQRTTFAKLTLDFTRSDLTFADWVLEYESVNPANAALSVLQSASKQCKPK